MVAQVTPQVVHVHDFELLPLALVLQVAGYHVIYDVHEDVPRDVLLKGYLPPYARRVIGAVAAGIEHVAGWVLDGIVAATPQIASRFPPSKTWLVRNYPRLGHFHTPTFEQYTSRPSRAVYAGTLATFRGLDVMVRCAAALPAPRHVALAGAFGSHADEHSWTSHPEWAAVEYLGRVPYARVPEVLAQSRVGLFVAQPTATMVDAYPTKVFEYLAAGLPAVVADWPLLRELFAESGACVFVDPASPSEILEAVQRLLDDEATAWAMGQRGAAFVRARYDWEAEAERLDAAYRQVVAA
jgi:glycosyltransferase involved in cell wall biosynthesis